MLVLFLIVVIDLVGFGIIIPLLPFYAERFQATPDMVTLVMATYSLAQLVSAPFWGRLSDRIGRRPVLLVSLAGASLSYVWLGYADSLWALFAARAVCGLMAGNISAAFAYVADVTDAENRTRGMGMIGAAYGLGFIAGPAIGGLLAGAHPETADFRTPALAAAGLSFAALVMGLIVLKESLSPEVRAQRAGAPRPSFVSLVRETAQNRPLAFWIVLSFLVTFVLAGMETTFAMWTERSFGWGPRPNGYLLAFIGILNAVIQGTLIGRLRGAFGERGLVLQGAAALALGCLLFPLASAPVYLIAVMTLMSYGFSVISPALNSLISLEAAPERQGSIMGLSRSASTGARVAGPAFAGVMFATFGKDAPYFASAVLMAGVLALVVLARTGRAAQHETDLGGD